MMRQFAMASVVVYGLGLVWIVLLHRIDAFDIFMANLLVTMGWWFMQSREKERRARAYERRLRIACVGATLAVADLLEKISETHELVRRDGGSS